MSTLFQFVDKGPIYPQDIFPGLGGGHEDEVPFDISMASRIRSLYKTSPIVSTAVGQFVSYVTRAPIIINGPGADFITPEQMKYEVRPVINQMIFEWVLYGYTNVCVAKSQVAPGRKTPVVVPFGFVSQTMKWDKNWKITYKADVTKRIGKKKSDISVLCLYPPDEQGMLTSPLAQCVVRLAYAEKLWATYLTGAVRSINPPYIFTQEHVTSSGQPGINNMPLSASIITSGALGQAPIGDIVAGMEKDSVEHTKKLLEETRLQRAEARAIQQAERNQARSSSDVVFDTDRVLPSTLQGQLDSDPLNNMYIAPTGHAVTSGPDFKTPSDFPAVIEKVYEEMYRALGLPVILLKSGDNSSGNAEFSTKILNDNIVGFQLKAAPLIAKMLEITFGNDIREQRADKALSEAIIAITDDGSTASSSSSSSSTTIEDGKLEVVFMSSPITNFELAEKAYTSGAITGEAFQDMVVNILNLPKEAKRPGIDAWLKQQRESGGPPAKRPRK